MNVYDFDNTIYSGDSTMDFYLFCLKRHKKILLYLPSLIWAFIKYYVLKIGNKTQFKETMYRFVRYCDIESDINEFWQIHIKKIKSWYIEQKDNSDVIISASPEFLLSPLKQILNINIIASKVNKHSGKYDGINCYYDEKVRRFYKQYPDGVIDKFYSDHYSDEPLAKIAKSAYIVNGEIILNWNFNNHINPRI